MHCLCPMSCPDLTGENYPEGSQNNGGVRHFGAIELRNLHEQLKIDQKAYGEYTVPQGVPIASI